MKKQENLLKKIDSLAFKKIDLFIQTNLYQRYTDLLKAFNQETKILINKGIILSSIFIPLLFLLIFFISNHKYANIISMKKEISSLSTKIIKYKSSIGKNSENIIGSSPILSKSEFDQIIRNLANRINLNLENIKVEEFTSTPKDSFYESNASIEFSKLTTDRLINFLYALTSSHQFKISGITISRDSEFKLLNGRVTLLHYSLNYSEGIQ